MDEQPQIDALRRQYWDISDQLYQPGLDDASRLEIQAKLARTEAALLELVR